MASKMSDIANHEMIRLVTPFIVAMILGICGWLFTSVLSLQQKVTLLNDGTVHNLEKKVEGLSDQIDRMNTILTDLRVSLGGAIRRDKRDEH